MTRYILDQEDVLLELDGSNNIVARYTHGPGIDEPLLVEKGGASFFYHADGLGSITEITDSAGALKQQYTYSSFGKIESQLDSNFVQPYTFTAREFDPETGLYFYRARHYDPATGRFLSEDLINVNTFLRLNELLKRSSGDGNNIADLLFKGFAIQSQNFHLLSYVRNNPVNLIDPTGNVAQIVGGVVAGALIGGAFGAVLGGVSTYFTSGSLQDALAGALTGYVILAVIRE